MRQHRPRRFLPILLLLMIALLAFPTAAAAKGIKVKKIKFKKYSGTLTITKGQKLTLKVKITPAKATNKKIKWSTSKKKVVTVTQKGVIKGKSTGKATITAKARDGSGKKAKLKIKVVPKKTAKKETAADPKQETASSPAVTPPAQTVTPASAAGCKIIAHRGYSSLAPENSLEAIRLALESGYDGVEIDIRVTKDKGFIVSHDDNLKALCGEDVSVKELTLAEAMSKKMITGTNLSSYPNTTLASLEQVLTLAESHPDKVIYIELKTAFYLPTLEKLLTAIRAHGVQDRVRLISFYKDNFTNIRSLTALGGDTIELGYLIERPAEQDIKDCIDLKLHPAIAFYSVTRDLTDTFHAAGLTVNAWTINQQTMVDQMIQEYQVDSLTCNQLFRK